MLFYFKSNEAWSEPAGVILLDIVNIQVEPVPIDGSWTFTLGNCYHIVITSTIFYQLNLNLK